MTLTAFAFYVFASVAVASGLFVTIARNPVHSVLWLILAFFSSAGLMVLLGAEFIAMLLIIVYVGAVAVLFLFVVMMLDVDFAALKQGMSRYLPVGALIGLVLIVELGLVIGHWVFADAAPEMRQAVIPEPDDVNNAKALGLILYDRFFYAFQASGLVLLVAMIGAIVLT
ncbi:MAG: NADH-quinone oxidoreductase subunit J, partial [Pseudomonadota bacterium]